MRALLIAFVSMIAVPLSRADDLDDLSLDQLADIAVTSPSITKAQSIREAAGIVSVITAEDIRALGARDLQEVLQLLPSTDFGVDVSNVVGLTFRGLWPHDGRVLLLIDGQIMNELAFSTTQFGHHYPVTAIERIEIIRGPGSANYGGFAGYGVINVISKDALSMSGGEGIVTYGATEEGRSYNAGQFSYGRRVGNLDITVSGTAGEGVRGNRDFRDFYGGSFDMQSNSDLTNRALNFSLKYKNFSLRYIKSDYGTQVQDVYYVIAPRPFTSQFETDRLEMKYEGNLADNLVATFRYNYFLDHPWHNNTEEQRQLELSDQESYGGIFFGSGVERHMGTANFSYDPFQSLNLLAGVSYFREKGEGSTVEGTPEDPYKANNIAIYGQAILRLPYFVVTAGTRYEDNSNYAEKVVSRVGITRAWKDWHAKLLYSEAFRAPQYQNVVDFYDPTGQQSQIKPESTLVWEMEIGRIITPNLSATINLFDITTRDTITYFYDPVNFDSYGNLGDTGSRGLEAQMTYARKGTTASLSYSFYRANNDNDAFAVQNPDGSRRTDRYLIGTSPHKLVLQGSTRFSDAIRWTSNLTWYGRKYGYTGVTEDDSLIAESIDPVAVLNSNVLFQKVVGDWLDVQFGVNNILNDRVQYFQPYNGYHAPLQGLSREAFLTVIGRF